MGNRIAQNVIIKSVKKFWNEEDGMGVVEIVLITVVLIGLVIIFKSQITSLVNKLLSKMTSHIYPLFCVHFFLKIIHFPTRHTFSPKNYTFSYNVYISP